MRRILCVALTCLLLPALPFAAHGQQRRDGRFRRWTCDVRFQHREAFYENGEMLVNVMGMIQNESPRLEKVTTASLYNRLLRSMTAFHETLETELPECAREINRAFLAAVLATGTALNALSSWHIRGDPDAYTGFEAKREVARDRTLEFLRIYRSILAPEPQPEPQPEPEPEPLRDPTSAGPEAGAGS